MPIENKEDSPGVQRQRFCPLKYKKGVIFLQTFVKLLSCSLLGSRRGMNRAQEATQEKPSSILLDHFVAFCPVE